MTMAPLTIVYLVLLQATCEASVQPLDPESHQKFFDKDYPHDKKPVADKHYVFDHPYPAVQDSNDFDKDFVKDQNSDGGKWDAQINYDKLRSQIREEKFKLKELEQKMYEEAKDVYEAKVAENLAEKEREEAEAATADANKAHAQAEAEVDRLGGAAGNATAEVKNEMSDLEDCKSKLEKAKAGLKKAMEEQKRLEEKMAKEKEKLEEERQSQLKELDEAQSKHEDAASAAKRTEEQLAAQKAEHEKVLKSYEEELEDVERTENQLARAAERLHRIRKKEIDPDGGVYYKKMRSGASGASASIAFLLSVAVLVLSGTSTFARAP